MKVCAKCRDAEERVDHCSGSRKTCKCPCTPHSYVKWCITCDNFVYGEVKPCDDCVVESVNKPEFQHVFKLIEELHMKISDLEDRLDEAYYDCSWCKDCL